MAKELGELFRIARQYGRVSVSTMDDGTYFAKIKFDTIEHTQLEAKSTFNEITPEAAVEKAIEVAQRIIDSIKNMPAVKNDLKLIG